MRKGGLGVGIGVRESLEEEGGRWGQERGEARVEACVMGKG